MPGVKVGRRVHIGDAPSDVSAGVLQCVAVRCSVFQCVVVCCSVLQLYGYTLEMPEIMCLLVCCWCVAVCCGVLWCVAVCCSCLVDIGDAPGDVFAGVLQ